MEKLVTTLEMHSFVTEDIIVETPARSAYLYLISSIIDHHITVHTWNDIAHTWCID